MVLRSGARPGQRVYVTGTIGDAALGVLLRRDAGAAQRWTLARAQKNHLLARYLLPQPRNAIAEAVRLLAAAAIDVSDGLAGDLEKLCHASGISAEIEIERIPLSQAARRAIASDRTLIETALTGGDDYEIVCTVEPAKCSALRAAAAKVGVPLTDIGVIRRGAGAPRFLDRDHHPVLFKRLSFSHF